MTSSRAIRVGVAADGRRAGDRPLAVLVAGFALRGYAVDLLDVDELARCRDVSAGSLSRLDVLVASGASPALLAVRAKAERLGVPVVDLDELPASAGTAAVDRGLADLVIARAAGAAAILTEP